MSTSTLLRSPIQALRLVGVYRLLHSSSVGPTLLYRTSYHANKLPLDHRTLGDLFSLPHQVTSHVSLPARCYAKKTKEKKGKSGKKGDTPKVALNETEIEELIDVHKMNEQMVATVEALQRDLMEKFSLRTNTASLENLNIETADGTFRLMQIGQIIQKNPNLIIINMDGASQYSKDVQQALTKSEMNLNPQRDGTSFFVPVPRVTREYREKMAKGTKVANDNTKERLKSIQNKYIKEAKKKKDDVSSDLLRHVQEHIMHVTKTFAAQADTLAEAKKQELLSN